ncbi:MAG TPA: hypothetical protein VJ729_11925 [Nitrososphaeraceae archaeon]|nr:hypothetical protein [Nitrososphaeraceae archaeon]
MIFAQENLTTPATISNSQNITPNNTAATNAISANFLTYENSTWGIKIQYPSNWVKQTSGKGITFAVLPNGTNNNNGNNLPQQFLAKLNLTSIVGFLQMLHSRHWQIVLWIVTGIFFTISKSNHILIPLLQAITA